jgi:hypothetical protein
VLVSEPSRIHAGAVDTRLNFPGKPRRELKLIHA